MPTVECGQAKKMCKEIHKSGHLLSKLDPFYEWACISRLFVVVCLTLPHYDDKLWSVVMVSKSWNLKIEYNTKGTQYWVKQWTMTILSNTLTISIWMTWKIYYSKIQRVADWSWNSLNLRIMNFSFWKYFEILALRLSFKP